MAEKRGTEKAVLVSGCSRGIGRAIAIRFGAEGYHVVANDLESQSDLLDDLTSEIVSAGGKCTALFADVSDDSSVAVMVAQAIKETGKIDVLVNNAGILSTNLIEDIPTSEWDRTFAVAARRNRRSIRSTRRCTSCAGN